MTLLVLKLIALLMWASWAARPAAPPSTTLAIEDVNVLPMNAEVVLEHRTVIVEDGIISKIGPSSELAAPPNAERIDGRGKYLMPALCDMHVHLRSEDELKLYTAAGITTIRNMGGSPWHLEIRNRIANGGLAGPRLFTSGPIMHSAVGPPSFHFLTVRTPGEARSSVAAQSKLDYDYVKVHRVLAPGVYEGLLEAAAKAGRPVVGHVPDRVGIEAVIRAGQLSIEHLTGYHPGLDLGKLIKLTIDSGIWNCFSLSPIWTGENIESIKAHEPAEIRYVPLRVRAQWRAVRAKNRNIGWYMQVLKRLHDAHAKLMLGTDTGTPYNIAGFAVHQELELAVKAGLRPYDALRYATVTPMEFLGESQISGTVEAGRRADLILLVGNPLDRIGNTRRIEMVITKHRVYSKEMLRKMLIDVAGGQATLSSE